MKSIANGHPSNEDLLDTFNELRDLINSRRFSQEKSSCDKQIFPDIFIMFDEAHLLTASLTPTDAQSHFSALRRVLQIFYNVSMFTFFLATTGKISQFIPPRQFDPSERMNQGKFTTPHPFVLWAFDLPMKDRKIFAKYKTLDDVTSLECIAHMGRPL